LDPKQFPDDRLEVSLPKKRIWGDVIFEIHCTVTKLTMPHFQPPPEPSGKDEKRRRPTEREQGRGKGSKHSITWHTRWHLDNPDFTKPEPVKQKMRKK
jgi:hypothetical protein